MNVWLTVGSSVNHCLKLSASFTMGTIPLKMGLTGKLGVKPARVPVTLPEGVVRLMGSPAEPPR